MNGQLWLGAMIISCTVVIQAICYETLIRFLNRFRPSMAKRNNIFADLSIIITTVLAIFAVHTVQIWVWAAIYIALGELTQLSDALYFSTVTFTTLGYGDITLSVNWRLLSAIEAINGILLFGWSTAFLFAVLTNMWKRKGLLAQ